MAKKIIIVIVEGTSDEIALEGSLRNIYNPSKVRFCIVRTDITSDNKVNRNNIKKKITELVKGEIERSPYTKSDISKVIHFTDMDGAYVGEDGIIENKSLESLRYSEECISSKSKEKILSRNKRKSENLNALSLLPKIYGTIPYNIYYLSCDQEHVLHNKTNVETAREKEELAENFNDKYEDDFEGFKKFISSEELAPKGDYRETWEFIKKEKNSLKRYSNLHLLLVEEGHI